MQHCGDIAQHRSLMELSTLRTRAHRVRNTAIDDWQLPVLHSTDTQTKLGEADLPSFKTTPHTLNFNSLL